MTRTTDLKHRPLEMPQDREALIRRAVADADPCLSVGGLAYAGPEDPPEPDMLVPLARLVELLRRERNQTVEQLASAAAVEVGEVVAVEQGRPASAPEVVGRLADALGVEKALFLQLAGFTRSSDARLAQLAMLFAARSEEVRPLGPQETQALDWFRQQALKRVS